MTELKGKSVIITGGSKGIGRETARLFLKAGAIVTITGRSKDSLKKTAKELKKTGSPVFTYSADVSQEKDCRDTVDYVIEKTGRIDILINNAGMSARGTFSESTVELFSTLTGINFLGPVMMSHFALDEIKRNRGSIVFISSIAALRGIPGLTHYSSSKMPLTAFSQALRGELKSEGVHISTIYVGFTENDPDKSIYDAEAKKIPLTRSRNNLSQKDVAAAVMNSVIKRKGEMTLSASGKIVSFLYRIFPGLSDAALAQFALKSPQYKEEK